ncbi:MAG TPA: hypothetical protein VJN90_05325, partial [Candidatus Acidoferrales bacterium]|nr:hypothetical protein [Candidatus Acidoferrales bacterium]
MPPKNFTRRDILKLGAIAPAAARAFASQSASQISGDPASSRQTFGSQHDKSPRERLLLDFNWRFHFGHASDPAKDFNFGGESAFAKTSYLFPPARHDFDDGNWQSVDLPHDFVVGLPFVNSPELVDYGFKPVGRNFPETSIGWYRRVFDIPASDANRRLSLEFDGVFRDCIVALNGNYLGCNLSGYAPFRYDITDFVNYGGTNILIVRVDATEHEGWFYEGAGIYRHVWLDKTAPVAIAPDGIFVSPRFANNVPQGDPAMVVEVNLLNSTANGAKVSVDCEIISPQGSTVKKLSVTGDLKGKSHGMLELKSKLASPVLWSPENPKLYKLLTTVSVAGKTVDQKETSFGIRTVG